MPGFLKFSINDLAQAAVFAALIAVLGIPGAFNLASGIPMTLQTLGVMMAGAVLGPRKGTLAVVIFMVLALAGLPILAGFINGTTSLASPGRGGFFLGFLPGAFVIGLLTAFMMPRYRLWLGILINILGGVVVIYACGIPYMMAMGHMSFTAAISVMGPYTIGDVIKAVLAALVAAAVHRGRPGLIAPIRLRRPAT
ncbi:BioY family protein [Gordonia hirsuta DSM 44140 = NBRC 16056]|uniref:Biotin transporter n=1 Tax=Gordonia hirsuta DSM 44140 = NBRC 16056 TaxID=1121927 RepID=L7L663_9ACTN|nr:biotin transporter BioY [Gordonia hirsuta]GAC56635.1 BioY family protein [Gordonia hirsuta DSM 44140 = NBRC 16056]